MSTLIEVMKTDGTTDIVTVEEAQELREAGELADAVDDEKALTLDEVYGEDFS